MPSKKVWQFAHDSRKLDQASGGVKSKGENIVKVIQIIDNFSVGGGVNSFVYDLCYALKEQGCDVSLIGILRGGYDSNPEVEKLRAAGIRVNCIGAVSKKSALLHDNGKLKGLIKDISKNEQTICNLHLKLSVLMGVLAARGLNNVKCIETYHNTYHHYHLQCWVCSPLIKKYICVSETAKEEMHQRFKVPYRKLIAIPNGVSRKRIRKLAKINEYNHEGGKTHIVSVGRLSYEKNFLVPVTALSDVCDENITYTLVGGGPEEEKIREVAVKNPNIRMTGALSRNETLQELAKADIVVMPSLWEGRSILQLEAMALDKPMIISDVPGLREPFKESALRDGEVFRVCDYGFLVETSNLEAYKRAIASFCDNQESINYTFIQSISEQNDMSHVANAYVEQYAELWKEKKL